MCVITSGFNCTDPLARDMSKCATRAGAGGGRATPGTHLEDQPGSGINTDAIRLVDGEEWVATDKWEYARRAEAQGQVTTLAGHSSEEGYADGCGTAAKFKDPSGVAVDADRYVWLIVGTMLQL